ncbi:FG-GAP-like repeat-containing protein [Streptomyces sp. NPDC005151]
MRNDTGRGRGRSSVLALSLVAAVSTLGTGLGMAAAAPDPHSGEAGKGVDVSALAKAKSSRKPVEIVEQRTESSEVYANPSGTLTVTTHLAPVRVRQGDTWVPVDTDLAFTEGGGVAPKAAATGLELSDGGEEPLVRLTENGHVLEYSWPDKLPKPRLDGPAATYAEVLPGVDLRVTVEAAGFQQLLVIKDATAARNPKLKKLSFGVKGNGLKMTGDEKQGIKAVDAKGRTVFSAPGPRMWDSSKGAKAGGRHAVMPTAVAGRTLTITPDRTLLTGPGTTYPVYVDPSFTTGTTNRSVVESENPNSAWWNFGKKLESGQYLMNTTYYKKRTFFQTDVNYLAGRQVIKSTLTLPAGAVGDCSAQPVELWHTGRATSTTTWNAQPAWLTKLATSANCPSGTVNLDATAAAKAASAAGSNTVDLGLRATTTGETAPAKSFLTWDAYATKLTTEIAYNGECFLKGDVLYKDSDGTTFTSEMTCESLATDARVEPYTNSSVTGSLLAGPHSFLCWRSGDMNGAGNRIWYYVKGDAASGWTNWQGWGYVPADKITGAGTEPFAGLPACNVHQVTPGLASPQDFNSDGQSDVVALQADGNLALYPGNGNGTLGAKRLLWSDARGTGYKEVFTADLNSDGKGDVAAVDSGNRVWWWPGDGDSGLAAASRTLNSNVTHAQKSFDLMCRDFLSTDFNGDGKGDILAACPSSDPYEMNYMVWWWPGDGNGEYNPYGGRESLYSANDDHSLTTADFDSDGRMDLANRAADGSLWLWRGFANGSVDAWTGGSRRVWPAASFGSVTQSFAGDFNGDRKGDMAGVDSAGSLWYWPGTGDGNFGTPVKMSSATDWGTVKDLM